MAVHCGDKFTTVIGHVRSDQLLPHSLPQHLPDTRQFLRTNFLESRLESVNSESKLIEEKEISKNENDAKDKKEDGTVNSHLKTSSTHSISFSNVMNYHQQMDKIIEKLLKGDTSSIDNLSDMKNSKEDSSLITNTDAGNVLLSLIARISELQVDSLISPEGKVVRNICDIDSYVNPRSDVHISNKKEKGIVGSLPYGVECTNVTFRSLLSLLETNSVTFCDDISRAIEGGEDKEKWIEEYQLQQVNAEDEEVENPKKVIGMGVKRLEEEEEKEEEKEEVKHDSKVMEKEKDKDRRRVHQSNESDGIIGKVLSRSSTSLSLSPSTTHEVVGGRRRRAVSNVEDLNQRNTYDNNSNNNNNNNNDNNINKNNNNNNDNDNSNNNNINNNIFNSKSNHFSRNFSTSSILKTRQTDLLFPLNSNRIDPEQHLPRKNDKNDGEKERSKINENGDDMKDREKIDENISNGNAGKYRKLFTTFGSLTNILTILKSNLIVLSLQIADANANANVKNVKNDKNSNNNRVNCENYDDIDNIIDINGHNDNNSIKITNNSNNNNNINNENNDISCHNDVDRNSFTFLDNSNDHGNGQPDSRLNPRSLSRLGSRGGIKLFYRTYGIVNFCHLLSVDLNIFRMILASKLLSLIVYCLHYFLLLFFTQLFSHLLLYFKSSRHTYSFRCLTSF